MSGWWLKIYTCYAFIEGNSAGSDQPRAACPDFPSGDQVYSLSEHIQLFQGHAIIWLFLWPEQHHFFRERYVLVTFFFNAILVIQKNIHKWIISPIAVETVSSRHFLVHYLQFCSFSQFFTSESWVTASWVAGLLYTGFLVVRWHGYLDRLPSKKRKYVCL